MLAADIAIAAATQAKQKFIKLAADQLTRRIDPSRSSDLAAAVATVELENGKHKSARKLFTQSLSAPTENSLAQAQWASERDSKIVIPTLAWDVPNSFEATAMFARTNRDWDRVAHACIAWLGEEPYSVKPAALGSFANFNDEQNYISVKLTSAALASNSTDLTLLNNRAVSLAYLGRTTEAFEDVQAALDRGDGAESPHLLATLGLIAYRRGDYQLGEECYGSAVLWFLEQKRRVSAVLAALFWIRETLQIDPAESARDYEAIKSHSIRLLGVSPDPETLSMFEYIEKGLADAAGPVLTAAAQEENGQLFSARQRFEVAKAVERKRNQLIHSIARE